MVAREQERVLVTGAAGMLGSQVLLAVPDGLDVVGTDLAERPGVQVPGVDLCEPEQVEELLEKHGPFTGVIHTAAYTAVDKAEEEVDLARRINRDACRVLGEATARRGLPLVLVSTDFVFDGEATKPYREDDLPNPVSVYGLTKYEGELAAREANPSGLRVVRTQWLYGPRGGHFPATMLRLARERDELKVVSDQEGSPTSTLELAPALWDVLESGQPTIYHAACEGSCTWYDLAVATLEAGGLEVLGPDSEPATPAEEASGEGRRVRVLPCSTAEFPRPARRPRYSVLDCSRLAELRGRPLAPWDEALKTYLGTEDA